MLYRCPITSGTLYVYIFPDEYHDHNLGVSTIRFNVLVIELRYSSWKFKTSQVRSLAKVLFLATNSLQYLGEKGLTDA